MLRVPLLTRKYARARARSRARDYASSSPFIIGRGSASGPESRPILMHRESRDISLLRFVIADYRAGYARETLMMNQ